MMQMPVGTRTVSEQVPQYKIVKKLIGYTRVRRQVPVYRNQRYIRGYRTVWRPVRTRWGWSRGLQRVPIYGTRRVRAGTRTVWRHVPEYLPQKVLTGYKTVTREEPVYEWREQVVGHKFEEQRVPNMVEKKVKVGTRVEWTLVDKPEPAAPPSTHSNQGLGLAGIIPTPAKTAKEVSKGAEPRRPSTISQSIWNSLTLEQKRNVAKAASGSKNSEPRRPSIISQPIWDSLTDEQKRIIAGQKTETSPNGKENKRADRSPETLTVEDFEAMTIEERIAWARSMNERYDNWFKNIEGILIYFQHSPTFDGLPQDSWMSVADAGTLAAIQYGENLAKGGSSDDIPPEALDVALAWQKFFDQFKADPRRTHELAQLWGQAEQLGVNYGVALGEQHAGNPAGTEGQLIERFTEVGNLYRSVLANGTSGQTSQEIARHLPETIEHYSGVELSPQMEAVLDQIGDEAEPVADDLGEWFFDPRSELEGTGLSPAAATAMLLEIMILLNYEQEAIKDKEICDCEE